MGYPGDKPGGKHLKLGPDELKKLKGKIDAALKELENSAGGKAKVSQESIPAASFGAGSFAEAADLSRMYDRVHTHLTNLSQTLGDQVEAMTIAIQWAENKYGEADLDQRRRFYEIQTRIQERYDEKHQKPTEHRTDRKQGKF